MQNTDAHTLQGWRYESTQQASVSMLTPKANCVWGVL